MRYLLLCICLFFAVSYLKSQSLSQLSFGEEETFEVVTWNIEWFPKDGQVTVDSVRQIIQSLDADLIAFQEISDTLVFRQMIDQLPEYSVYMESLWYGGLVYTYKPDRVDIIQAYEIYETEPFWNAFPRSPLVLEALIDGKEVVFINNHLKCCGDGDLDIGNDEDEENRRYEAMSLLKDYIDDSFSDKMVFLLGDLNDNLNDPENDNVFSMVLEDEDEYWFADLDIALNSPDQWSFPNYPSHLDHILVTNEVFNDPDCEVVSVQTILVDDFMAGGFNQYDAMISDHRPVGIKVNLSGSTSVQEDKRRVTQLRTFPNPAESTLFFYPDKSFGAWNLSIYDARGFQVASFEGLSPYEAFSWDINSFESGVYFAKAYSDESLLATNRIFIIQ